MVIHPTLSLDGMKNWRFFYDSEYKTNLALFHVINQDLEMKNNVDDSSKKKVTRSDEVVQAQNIIVHCLSWLVTHWYDSQLVLTKYHLRHKKEFLY